MKYVHITRETCLSSQLGKIVISSDFCRMKLETSSFNSESWLPPPFWPLDNEAMSCYSPILLFRATCVQGMIFWTNCGPFALPKLCNILYPGPVTPARTTLCPFYVFCFSVYPCFYSICSHCLISIAYWYICHEYFHFIAHQCFDNIVSIHLYWIIFCLSVLLLCIYSVLESHPNEVAKICIGKARNYDYNLVFRSEKNPQNLNFPSGMPSLF